MKRLVIIGNSAAGISCAEAVRKHDKEIKITIISREDYVGYNRCLLSYFLAGDIKEDSLIYRPKEFYQDNNIELLLNKKVVQVMPKKNQILLEDKTRIDGSTTLTINPQASRRIDGSTALTINPQASRRIDYDILVLASGSSAKIPQSLKGITKKGVFGFRTIEDVKGMLELAPIAHNACILGGGLIGLKAAYGLKKRNLEIKVIVKSPQVLSQVLDKESAELFRKHLSGHGIEILSGADVSEIIGNGDCKAVKLDSGKVIATNLVVVGKGVKPNIEFLKDSGINLDEGVSVDEHMKTNVMNIYAAGDIAQAYDPILEKTAINALWPNAIEQGLIAAENILGRNKEYAGSIGMNSVEFFGLPAISFGITRPPDNAYEEVFFRDLKQGIYKKIIIKNNIIKGAIFVNKIENIGVLLKLARLKVNISVIKDKLLHPDFNFAVTKDLVYAKEEFYI